MELYELFYGLYGFAFGFIWILFGNFLWKEFDCSFEKRYMEIDIFIWTNLEFVSEYILYRIG